jgi:hypothetical protein
MYRNIQTFTLRQNVGKHFYWNIAGSLDMVFLVIWFVVAVLLLLSALGTSTWDKTFWEAAVDFVTDIAKIR